MPEVQDAANFEAAVDKLLRHEGGFCIDEGGPTNFGVSLRFARTAGDLDHDGWQDADVDHDGDVDEADIRAMTRDDAARIYRVQWWDRYGYGAFTDSIATKLLDLSVNMGPDRAHRIFQQAINECGIHTTVDGALGPKTRLNAGLCPEETLLVELREAARTFYIAIIANNPKCTRYKKGWVRRALA